MDQPGSEAVPVGEEVLQEAAALSDQERWEEAYDLLLRQEPQHPDDPMLLSMLGAVARELGAVGQAYDYFRRCLALQPSDPLILSIAGQGVAAFDDPEAESVLRLAALSAPHLAATRLNYGSYLTREGLFDLALSELQAARELDPQDVVIRLELGAAYLLAGQLEAGTAELGEALLRDPDDSWIRLLYALALLESGSEEEGAEELLRSAEDRPEDWEAQIVAAVAAATQDWSSEAWNALARADIAGQADPLLVQEAEDALEAGSEAAHALLHGDLLSPLLRSRLLER